MTDGFDAVDLEIVRNQLDGLASEMGRTLIRGAFSPNIKERRDGSTALFDPTGRLVAQAEHIPVHLGAMPDAVAAVIEHADEPGATYLLNDPYLGGSHLPDVTVVAPLTVDGEIAGYGAVRAHYADVGGMTPGSLPASAREIYAEGIRIPPVPIADGTNVREEVVDLLMANVRQPDLRRADLRAQLGAIERGNRRLEALVEEHSLARLLAAYDAVIEYARDRTVSALRALPTGTYHASDALEGDGIDDREVPIEVAVHLDDGGVTVDFDGTAGQVRGPLNAPPTVTRSAVYFVMRCVTDPDIPSNQGCYDPIDVVIPAGSLLDPSPPAAVSGGNVETSQRVADVVLAALRPAVDGLPAHGQGTMNNLTVGFETADRETYYETIAGGAGARPDGDGTDGIHVGMTNTRNTPVEALERTYPVIVRRYGLRPGTGGDGRHRGGLGIERRLEVVAPAEVSVLSERRRAGPPGAEGGDPGAVGRNLVDGEAIGAKATVRVDAGTVVTVLTPGGGGYGPPVDRATTARREDRLDGKTDGDDHDLDKS